MPKKRYNPYAVASTETQLERLVDDQAPHDAATENPYLITGHALTTLGQAYDPYRTKPLKPFDVEEESESTVKEEVLTCRWIDRGDVVDEADYLFQLGKGNAKPVSGREEGRWGGVGVGGEPLAVLAACQYRQGGRGGRGGAGLNLAGCRNWSGQDVVTESTTP